MFLIYDETLPNGSFRASSSNIDPTKMALVHFSNSLYLQFILNKSEDPAERRQARHELDLAERKIKHWMSQGVDMGVYTSKCLEEKKKWT